MSDEARYSHLDAATMRRVAAAGNAAAGDECAAARDGLARALRLHQARASDRGLVCAECSRIAAPADVDWPCPTAIALGAGGAAPG